MIKEGVPVLSSPLVRFLIDLPFLQPLAVKTGQTPRAVTVSMTSMSEE